MKRATTKETRALQLPALQRISSRQFFSFFRFFLFHSGYARQYKALARFLSSQFTPEQVQVVGLEDRGVTGNFEVTAVLDSSDDGKAGQQLLHSKRQGGQGKAESAQERAMIVEQIKELLLENEQED